MIASLIWKDIRLSAPVLLAGVLLLVAPYACAFAWIHVMAIGNFPWAKAVLVGSYGSQWLSLLSAALMGGNVFACEREDGSDSFLASLPLKRGDMVFSKLAVSLVALESIWIANPLISRAALRSSDLPYSAALPDAIPTPTIAAIAVMVFGLSWAWSAIANRPLTAALGGLSSCGIVYVVTVAFGEFSILKNGSMFAEALPTCAFSLGVIGVVFGSAKYRPSGAASLGRLSKLRAAQSKSTSADVGMGSRGRNSRRALLWKDARLLAVALLMGFGLLALPYLTAAIDARSLEDATERYAYAAMQSLWACCLVLPMWGGYIIAAERASGSERFLSYLPASRSGVVSSKLFVSLVPSAVALIANAVLTIKLHEAIYFQPVATPVGESFYNMTWSTLISQRSSLLFSLPVLGAPAASYGVAWFFAARLKQPLLGVAMGMMSSAGVLLLWLAYYGAVEEQLGPMAAAASFALCVLVFGGIAVASGSRRLLRETLL